jgi:hypothetical protein
MTSIYQRVLGDDFQKLHPQIQRRFGFDSTDHLASIGHGIMDEVWYGPPYTLPFLYIGTWRNIMFPEKGQNVPFTIHNYAFVDPYGRETVSWVRTFDLSKTRRFDAYMIYSEVRDCIVDYLGNHEHLAVDIHMSVDDRGGICIRSGQQRFYEGILGFRFPMLFSGIANVCEWYDDETEKFCIEVTVHNKIWGKLFGYRGTFDVEWRQTDTVPADILPHRYEPRE